MIANICVKRWELGSRKVEKSVLLGGLDTAKNCLEDFFFFANLKKDVSQNM